MFVNDWRPKLIFLSETHVSGDIEPAELNVKGYQMVNCLTNNRRTGGVMALIREDMKYKIRSTQCEQGYLWLLSVEVNIGRIKYLCSVIYHPPQAENAKFIDCFSEYLGSVSLFGGVNIIVGDFNFDLLKTSFYGDKLLSTVYMNGFAQIVDSPTRITERSQTLIDYIVTNSRMLSFKVHLTPRISDHCILSIHPDVETIRDRDVLVTSRSMKNYNIDRLQDGLLNTLWTNDSNDVNVLADSFIESVADILNVMCPKEQRVFKQKYMNKVWITGDVKTNMQVRDNLYVRAVNERNSEVWEEYKRMRNKVVRQIRTEKERHFLEVIDNNRENSREMWKNLKQLLPEKKCLSAPYEICFENDTTSDEGLIVHNFNKYFVNSIEEIVSRIPQYAHPDEAIFDIPRLNTEFSRYDQLTMTKLKGILKNLKNVGGGLSGVSKKVLLDVCDVVGNRLLNVVNASLSTGQFPDKWKESIVIPVAKILNTKNYKEFRPINTVEIYEKVLEITVKEQLCKYCDDNNILVVNQSGFREEHSCETVIVNTCDIFKKEMDRGNYVIAVFLDFKRAFETVDRNILLQKLSCMGLKDNVLSWFKSYLSNRQQRVKFKNCVSESLYVRHGVPQGTVLGPLLFLLYINDLVRVIDGCSIELFADDTMIYLAGRNLEGMQQTINRNLEKIFEWLCINKLCINTSKSKFCLFGKKHSLNDVNIEEINIVINNDQIKHESYIKYLGVILDANLNFCRHAEYITRKFSKKVSFISRIGDQLSMGTKLLLYNSIAAPHLSFCSTLLYGLPACKIDQIQIVQNRAMRTVLKCNRYTPIATMLNVSNLLSVKENILVSSYVFIFKLKNKMLPSYICDRFVAFRDIHDHGTRNCDDFVLLDKCNTNLMLNSVLHRGVYNFNMLPKSVKDCRDLNVFKKLVKAHVRSL